MTNNNTIGQSNIFDMFDLVDEATEIRKKEEAEKAAKLQAEQAERLAKAEEIRQKLAQSTKDKPAETSKKEEVVVFTPNEETIIRYYGVSLEITTYFTPEELAEGLLVKQKEEMVRKPLDPEMLRKRMEKDYPELVKSHTEMVYLKEKNLVIPSMRAKKKGNCTTALSTNSAFLFGTTHKIPFGILRDFIAVANMYGEIRHEVHADIYFCPHKQDFFLDFPQQLISPITVEVIESDLSILERLVDAIKVLEIHSHHSMAPTPSSLDNVSETRPGMFYAIIGRTNNFLPSMSLRQFISDDEGHIQIDIADYFESPFYGLPTGFDTNVIEFGGTGL